MGLLDYISQKAKEIPDNAKAAYRGLLAAPEELAALFSPEMRQRVNQAMNTPATLDRDKAVGMAMDYLQTTPAGLLGHIVYHGSPHKFNKFDMSKIGTGEGAQAYGHGLYFAESPNIADWYRKKLTPGQYDVKELGIDGVGFKRLDFPTFKNARQGYGEAKLTKKQKDILNQFSDDELSVAGDIFYSGDINKLRDRYAGKLSDAHGLIAGDEARLKILEGIEKRLTQTKKGNFYKVDIPDEAIPRMLDWDNGGEQTYRNLVNDVGRGIRDRTGPYWDMIKDDPNRLMYHPADVATKVLKQQGIPGIKYLDGMSRGDTGGTSNFVLFDDQLPRILEVNGQPTGLLSYADEAAQKPKPKKAK